MAFFHDAIGFANPAAVSAMPAEKLADGMFYICRDLGTGLGGLYLYSEADASVVDSPKKIAADNGPGRFGLFGAISIDGGGGGGGVSGGGLQAISRDSPLGEVTPTAERSQILQQTTIAVEEIAKEILWVANGTTASDWIIASASNQRAINYGNPDGFIMSDIEGQLFLDLSPSEYGGSVSTYVAMTAGGYSWVLI